jgi:hypothetical protein
MKKALDGLLERRARGNRYDGVACIPRMNERLDEWLKEKGFHPLDGDDDFLWWGPLPS